MSAYAHDGNQNPSYHDEQFYASPLFASQNFCTPGPEHGLSIYDKSTDNSVLSFRDDCEQETQASIPLETIEDSRYSLHCFLINMLFSETPPE